MVYESVCQPDNQKICTDSQQSNQEKGVVRLENQAACSGTRNENTAKRVSKE